MTHPGAPNAPVNKADMAAVMRVTSLGDKGVGTPWDSGDAPTIAAAATGTTEALAVDIVVATVTTPGPVGGGGGGGGGG